MLSEASNALAEQDGKRHLVDIEQLKATGVIIAIEGPGPTDEPASSRSRLKLESLDQMSRHRDAPRPKWILLNVTPATDQTPERAQVWISDEYRAGFLRLFERFLHEDHATSGKPKNRAMVANMNRVRSAVLRDLWQSGGDPPVSGLHWWEIWMRPETDAIHLATAFARRWELRLAERHLRLNNRHIIWLQCRWSDLQTLMVSAVPVAEIRRPQFVDTIEDLDHSEQEEYVRHLSERLVLASDAAPAVCLLDTGVRRTHELLNGSLAAQDMHTVVGEPVTDRHGHGTRMAGLALLGPLDPPLLGSDEVRLRHRLESVKYLPDSGPQLRDPESYGVATAEAVALPEIASKRRRAYNLAITAQSERPGEPSLWSAAIDALAVGTDVGRSPRGIDLLGAPQPSVRRLIIVSAGNVRLPYELDYVRKCDISPIEDPAQAWNALTVGAYTELDALPSDPSFESWMAVATSGDISPHSRTGLVAGGARWPLKPDLCMEGGNVMADGHGDFIGDHSLLSLRATSNRDDTALEAANATSAAAAQASRLAARAIATYPDYWPETIRGLMTHSADWTPVMRERVLAETSKTSRAQMVRRYGWGVPDDSSVQTSARNAVTMVVQDEFIPFTGTFGSTNSPGRQASSTNSERRTSSYELRFPTSSNHPHPEEVGVAGICTHRMASGSSCARPTRPHQTSSVA